jgi:hypothetical protein
MAMEWYAAKSSPLSPKYGHHSFISWLELQLNPQMYRCLANIHPQDSFKTENQMLELLGCLLPGQLGYVEFDRFVNSLHLYLVLRPLRWVT